MKKIEFYKLSGSGNDFIIIDNRDRIVDENNLPAFISKVCRRKLSVGADGFILVENSDVADFKWRFYNSDGSNAEMCGNGARCVARFAYFNNISGKKISFETDAGIISAEVINDRVKVKLPDPFDFQSDYTLKLKNSCLTVSSINTGVPHVVLTADEVDDMDDLFNTGKEIRFHERYAPAGTNVNFVCLHKDGENNSSIKIRTYERGVEDETLACGTGSIAGALVMAKKFGLKSPVNVITRGGESLKIYFKKNKKGFKDIFLEGNACIIYKGEIFKDAWI